MSATRKIRSSWMTAAIIAAAGISYWAYGNGCRLPGRGAPRDLVRKYRLAPVGRTVLEGSMTTQGHLESSKRTVIDCELQRIGIGVAGRGLAAGGSTTLLTVVPDGARVKAGEVLATLDSSDYEELVRQQTMTVERSRADHRRAELDFEVATMAVDEYRDGTMKEALKDHERLIALAESEVSRSRDRLDWATRMQDKGYVSLSVLKTETQNFDKADVALKKARGDRHVFEQFTARKMIRQLEGAARSKQSQLRYQDVNLARNLERLATLEKQVANCTIRAPHDGYVIYANDPRHSIVIEPGITVRQKQHLFYLPDLEHMEVVAMLHESVVDRVKKGMRARIALEGAPDVSLSGRVRSIAPLPIMEWRHDVRYFEGIVTIDEAVDRELMPGMTARIELSMPSASDVLAVPVEAVTTEQGAEYCYVMRRGGERLEKRRIESGQATHDLLEVARGLEEGEQVVLNPRVDEVADDLDEQPAVAEPSEPPAAVPLESPVAALR